MKGPGQILDLENLSSSTTRQVFPKGTRWRVKVFALNQEDVWADQGTGGAQIVKEGNMCTFTVNDDKSQVILQSDLTQSRDFKLDNECIILWTDDKNNNELAVSFKNAADAQQALKTILDIREGVSQNLYEKDFALDEPLPTTNIENLEKIEQMTSSALLSSARKDKVVNQLLKNDQKYLKELISLFEDVEDLEDTTKLRSFFKIAKAFISYNNQSLLMTLMNDKYYASILGFLEYDPGIDIPQPEYRYRKFFENKAQFLNTVQIKDIDVIHKIHLNYRLIFLKDTATASWIEDPTLAILSDVILTNCQDILNHIFNTPGTAEKIVQGLEDPDIDKKVAVLGFLLDICNNSKQLQTESKRIFFERLINADIIELLIKTMMQSPARNELHKNFEVPKAELIKTYASELLIDCLQVLPDKVKSLLLSEKQKANDYKILSLLLTLLEYSPTDGLKFCLNEFYKALLDPDTKELKTEFSDVFYDKLIVKLVKFLSEPLPSEKCLAESYALSQHLILDLLCYCAKISGCRVRYFILHSGMFQTLNSLYKSPFKFIRLDMLRLLRSVIGTKDEPLCRSIVKNDLLKPVFDLLKGMKKDNIICSAVLELFNFIAKENIKTLIVYLWEKYTEEITNGKFASTMPFKQLNGKFEKLKEDKLATKLTETAMTALGKKSYLPEKVKRMNENTTAVEESIRISAKRTHSEDNSLPNNVVADLPRGLDERNQSGYIKIDTKPTNGDRARKSQEESKDKQY